MEFIVQAWNTLYSLAPIPMTILRALVGTIMVFFMPGFAWSLIFFSGKQVNILERIVLSIGLSIALVTLSVLFANVAFGVRITLKNSVVVIILISSVPLLIYWLKKRLLKRSHPI